MVVVKADRRTSLVLGSLLGAMTISSGLLLLLEPRPMVPVPDISLNALTPEPISFEQQLFTTTRPLAPWRGIVIHASGSQFGNAQTIHDVHQRLGLGSLGYHFVIHNGNGGPDGYLTRGPRWNAQGEGAYCGGPDADLFNRHALGVCLIGNFDQQAPTDAQLRQLVELVNALQQRFDIPDTNVWLQTGAPGSNDPGKLFPLAAFQRQLLAMQ